MDKFPSQEARNQFLAEASQREKMAIRLQDGVPCCVKFPEPCLNKATVVFIQYLPLRECYQFLPPLCKEYALAMQRVYESNVVDSFPPVSVQQDGLKKVEDE